MKRTVTPLLTEFATCEIEKLLTEIITHNDGVVGALAVGYDGCILASALPAQMDLDSASALSMMLFRESEQVVTRLCKGNLRQVRCSTPDFCISAADFGGGLLVSISDGSDLESFLPDATEEPLDT
jgi:predicted regulator of Ras-like GTPase activity (Roadblock/LC7/MglB family)